MIAILAIGIIGLITVARAVRVVQQYERGVVFRFNFLDRVTPAASAPAPAVANRTRVSETAPMPDVRRVTSEPDPGAAPMPVS
ncbi:hypothetical protein AB0F73_23890 [Micromonospora purpureochromogenes]|uniref:hypothetical protein n=1 Tax=Micromonospora purpureochromogenes TaxID=47872 RepID=UPI0033D7938F